MPEQTKGAQREPRRVVATGVWAVTAQGAGAGQNVALAMRAVR